MVCNMVFILFLLRTLGEIISNFDEHSFLGSSQSQNLINDHIYGSQRKLSLATGWHPGVSDPNPAWPPFDKSEDVA